MRGNFEIAWNLVKSRSTKWKFYRVPEWVLTNLRNVVPAGGVHNKKGDAGTHARHSLETFKLEQFLIASRRRCTGSFEDPHRRKFVYTVKRVPVWNRLIWSERQWSVLFTRAERETPVTTMVGGSLILNKFISVYVHGNTDTWTVSWHVSFC